MKYVLKYKDKETQISINQFNELMSDIDDNDISKLYVDGNKTVVETYTAMVYFDSLSVKEKELVEKLVELFKKVADTYGLSYDDVWESLLVDRLKDDD